MSEHVYKQVELTGSSKVSVDGAVQSAIAKASQTPHNLDWFQVVETREKYYEGQGGILADKSQGRV